MGYQLAVWEGQQPADDEAASAEWAALAARYLSEVRVDPTPAIRRFVDSLTERWTDDPKDPRFEGSPWKWVPVLDDASGPVVYLDVVLGDSTFTSTLIAATAREQGLVCFDFMIGMRRPVAQDAADAFVRDWPARYAAEPDERRRRRLMAESAEAMNAITHDATLSSIRGRAAMAGGA